MRWMIIAFVFCVGCRTPERAPSPTATPSTTKAAPTSSEGSSIPTTASAAVADSATNNATTREWSFEGDTEGSAPLGFSFGRTGTGHEGKWIVRAEPGAPSGSNVIAQTDADTTDDRFPVAFTVDTFPADADVSVKCKPVSGAVDRACGLVLRLSDANNYYLTRANALENNVRFYVVRGGHRRQLASWTGSVTAGAWHDYRITAIGDHFEIFWDGSKVLDTKDSTFTGGGRIGVWTKADSVTYFDNLSVKPLR